MTGESEPVRKQPQPADETADGPEQPGCLYRGTQVVDGVGQMIVTEVGDATYLGQIARKLSADDGEDEEEEAAADTAERRVQRKLTISKELTPLQLKLKNLADLICKVGYIAAGADLSSPCWCAACCSPTRERSSGRNPARTALQVAQSAAAITSSTWSSSSWWRCRKACR